MKKAILLFSSGLDSSVAGYMARNKNLDVIGLHFNQQGKNSKSIQKVLKLAKVIGIKKIYVIDHDIVMKQVLGHVSSKFYCVFCKRFMVRIASELGKKLGCNYVIDGSNLGQVASQTLENLNITTHVSAIPVIKPLLCFEKQETMDIAKEIGTFDLSNEKENPCKYLPANPATKSTERIILFEESKLDVDDIVSDALNNAYIL